MNVGALSAESRRALLEVMRGKLGWSGALAALGISGAALSRYLSGKRAVPDDMVRRALGQLEEQEFLSAVGSAAALDLGARSIMRQGEHSAGGRPRYLVTLPKRLNTLWALLWEERRASRSRCRCIWTTPGVRSGGPCADPRSGRGGAGR